MVNQTIYHVSFQTFQLFFSFNFFFFSFCFSVFFSPAAFFSEKEKKNPISNQMLPHHPFSFSFFGFFLVFFLVFCFEQFFFFFFVCEKERKKEKERERERFNKKEKKTKKNKEKGLYDQNWLKKSKCKPKIRLKKKKKKKNWICIGPILMEAWTTKKKQEHLNSFSPPCQISRKKITPKIKIGFSAKKFFFFVFYFCLIFVFGFCFLKDEKNRLLEIKRFLVFSMYHFYIKKEKWKTNLFFSKWER